MLLLLLQLICHYSFCILAQYHAEHNAISIVLFQCIRDKSLLLKHCIFGYFALQNNIVFICTRFGCECVIHGDKNLLASVALLCECK